MLSISHVNLHHNVPYRTVNKPSVRSPVLKIQALMCGLMLLLLLLICCCCFHVNPYRSINDSDPVARWLKREGGVAICPQCCNTRAVSYTHLRAHETA